MATVTRKQRTPEELAAIADEALLRARMGRATTNYHVIYREFMDRGIPYQDIKPRENVLTFHAWRAKGRTVKKGEKGVKVVTWIPIVAKDGESKGKEGKVALRCTSATVFHESQTKELERVG